MTTEPSSLNWQQQQTLQKWWVGMFLIHKGWLLILKAAWLIWRREQIGSQFKEQKNWKIL